MNNYYYVVFSSVTFATRIKKQFTGYGWDVSMLHTPRSIPVNGCSYSIKVKRDKLRHILNAAKEMGIRYKGVYVENDGRFEEAAV